MRSLILPLLVAGQLTVVAQPALAAGLEPGEQTRVGMFGGLQVRLPIGGEARTQRPSFALGVAPVARSQRLDGSGRMRIGEGFQLRLRPQEPVELRLAGTRLDRLNIAPNGQAPGGQRAGVSTLGWIGIGVGVLAVTGAIVFYAMITDDDRCCE
jgi:hypothetical protein